MGFQEGGRSTKISFSNLLSLVPASAMYGRVRASRDRPLLPSEYCWPITICAPLACSYTILPQIRSAKLSASRQSATSHTPLQTDHTILDALLFSPSSSLSIDGSMMSNRPFVKVSRTCGVGGGRGSQVRREEPWTTRLP